VPSWRKIHLKEADMPQGDKHTDKQKRQAGGVARPEAEPRGWATVNKLQGGGKKINSRRKVPSGPVGGSGRKTNLSRSS
jgi:hypothetical protein